MKNEEKHPFSWGIISGIGAGLVLGLFMMFIVAPVLGKSVFAPLNMIGAVIMGEGVLADPTAVSIIVGLILHMVNSAIFGVIFAYLWKSLNKAKGAEITSGLAYGIIIWAVMTYVVLPLVGSQMATVTGHWFFWAHLLFGLAIGYFTPKQLESKSSSYNHVTA